MILTPLSASIPLFLNADSISSLSKGVLAFGATGVPGTAKPLAVDTGGNIITVISTNSGFGFYALKAEDNAFVNGDGGYHMLAVRRDSDGAQTSNNGDYESLQTDANGRLKTNTNGTVTANAGTNLNTSLLAVESGGNLAQLVARVPSALTGSGNFKTAILEALPAGVNLIGRMSSSDETSTIYNGTTALTPKFASIDLAASGDLLAAVASKILRVISLFFVAAAETTIRFQSGGTTNLSGVITVKAGFGAVLGENTKGWLQTLSGEKLNVVLGTSVQVSGFLSYLEV